MDSTQSSTHSIPRYDVTSLTTFNPFSEEDEHDQSSYALVTSLFSKVKNTLLTTQLTGISRDKERGSDANPNANTTNATNAQSPTPAAPNNSASKDLPTSSSNTPNPSSANVRQERPNSLSINSSNPAPPLVFLTPVVSEVPSFYDAAPPSRGGGLFTPSEVGDGGYGTAIPGFPIADDARSVMTSGMGPMTPGMRRTGSVSKVIRRIRGEGESFLIN